MRLVSFDALRACDIPGVVYIKPENTLGRAALVRQADVLLFPEYWQVNGLYYGWKKNVFPSISTYHLGHDKIEMTRAIQMLWPHHMPETYILPNSHGASEWVLERLVFPFIAKTARESMGRGVWLIRDTSEWRRYREAHSMLYVQEYLPIERDMRLVVIGRNVVAGYWKCLGPDGLHTNVARGGRIDPADVPDAAVVLVEQIAQHLDIDYAGFDIAEMSGHYYFFEFNRLFGTAGLHRQGISTGRLISHYLQSRAGLPSDRPPSLGGGKYRPAA